MSREQYFKRMTLHRLSPLKNKNFDSKNKWKEENVTVKQKTAHIFLVPGVLTKRPYTLTFVNAGEKHFQITFEISILKQ